MMASYRFCELIASSRLAVLLLVCVFGHTGQVHRSIVGSAFECGISKRASSLIIGGEEAIAHEFPWQVSLQKRGPFKSAWQHNCGGSLIDEQWVLTAGHCFRKVACHKYRIAAGGHNLSGINELDGVYRKPKKCVVNPMYHSAPCLRHNYDFALVQLNEPVDFAGSDGSIAPVCLPSEDDFDSFDDQECIASGWGQTSRENRTRPSDILKKVQIKPISFEKCRADYLKRDIYAIGKSILCTSSETQSDVYKGDSGSPLQCERGHRYVLAGLVSGGYRKIDINLPMLYARVSEAVSWINKVRTEQTNKLERSEPAKQAAQNQSGSDLPK
ncbi:chymotrypsinogen B-like [Varroa jacobsoni]|uniref:Peptidase S1 domain-containing protein n=1 Tax=Varroa destructor TaxID=109461 RepID=A0A7M7JZX3_VARDE|nr:chymotrypsinogen B-like [Varroa destructor]XP_022658192.1 chymotrypsinogen B-like [Varroa destructor]XP_022658193.1 chymotrypsinogen B-like [Varroa destructor]XP_022658194.1 chymotrypsinogen B-like [Varroa destructor]XP_022658195.1 chymotrypsinogen B-like [Varroa destructor]XP_022686260.1 chymotrypsinogen B-like [Varroa jacobsoni]XP_022686261.1 chymotrypsinogen B-like [Varroa jacobsoni]XP_022686262.1 chymotrypsinogen B-like [Varroa jacobsoni]